MMLKQSQIKFVSMMRLIVPIASYVFILGALIQVYYIVIVYK